MAGLRKAKKYDWKDSNMELFGSDTDRSVKKASAQTEKAWQGAGQKVGLEIWRINKFKVEHWPKEKYGEFYNGDSYIILNTYKEKDSDKLLYDVHFWIGKYSTQDEYGTAAYKTVELDTLLDDVPVQHREVQNNESDMFKSYFRTIKLLKGGADSGFRKVIEEKPVIKRLFRFSKEARDVKLTEVAAKRSNINSGDVFILDKGDQVYLWKGKDSNASELFTATQYVASLKSERSGKLVQETLDENEEKDVREFMEALEENDDEPDDSDDEDIDQTHAEMKKKKSLYKLSNESGELKFSLVKEGKSSIEMSDFKSDDVFIFDCQKEVFVWVGKRANEVEKNNGMVYAHKYLMETDHPFAQVTVLKEGRHSASFDRALREYY